VSLRTRVALIAAVAVAAAILVASVGLYLTTERTLYGNLDASLLELVGSEPAPGDTPPGPGARTGPYGGAGGFVQAVTVTGDVLRPAGRPTGELLPVSVEARAVAAGELGRVFETVTIGEVPVRILTVPLQPGVAVQVALPLTDVEAVLDELRDQLLLAGLLGVLLAGTLGMLVAQRAVRPVKQLTHLAEEVARTQDLSRRIAGERDDEIGRLAAAFDQMLGELEQARSAQEQLVADASHELRTPLTSLRTNIEVLSQFDRLELADREALARDVVLQLDEFAALVSALTELARGDRPTLQLAPIRLDEVVTRVVARDRRTDARVQLEAEPTTVLGDEVRIDRAVAELLENARKYAPGADVEVAVTADGHLTVRDHGPGIAAEDRPRVTGRFYRAAAARGAPGSGLGLAIVAQIMRAHDGDLEVFEAPGGGAGVTLRFPPWDG
jgi:two-component system, OmpR family, sensor histidine kinase MprB